MLLQGITDSKPLCRCRVDGEEPHRATAASPEKVAVMFLAESVILDARMRSQFPPRPPQQVETEGSDFPSQDGCEAPWSRDVARDPWEPRFHSSRDPTCSSAAHFLQEVAAAPATDSHQSPHTWGRVNVPHCDGYSYTSTTNSMC